MANPPTYDSVYPQPNGQPMQMHSMPAQPVLFQPQPQMIVVQQQPGLIVSRQMDVEPVHIICHSCNYSVMTKTEIRPALRTHLWAACCCVFGLWPCCIVPYCIPSCNIVDHSCPKCNAYIGSYNA